MYEESPKVIFFSGNRECPTVRIVISVTVQALFFYCLNSRFDVITKIKETFLDENYKNNQGI